MNKSMIKFAAVLLSLAGEVSVGAEQGRLAGDGALEHTERGRPAPAARPSDSVRVEVRQLQMGVMATLSVYAPDVETGRRACAAAFGRVRELNAALSDYDQDSELRRLLARAGQGPVPVGPDLLLVLSEARLVAERSGGRVDPTIGPLVQLWRGARRTRRMPAPEAIAEARQLVGYGMLHLDPRARTVSLDRPGMKLDLGAIAKGYAGDAAIAVLRSNGFPRAMFEAGGDMVFGDPPPGRSGWPVETENPSQRRMELANCALSVSGDTVQFVEIEGRRYSHVIDPSSGLGLTNQLMCVVQAESGLQSDPLSTAGTLMPETAFRSMLSTHYPEAQAWIFPSPSVKPQIDAD
jgi:FAD:protein FMN transferase